ncbi:MAG TPA: laccase domain-containing protein [Candidatus Chromulinivoraceae bacterium]|nr:laccase domain-containing protein [Candidatus Chromulinivoraceae bacterium]
MIASDQPTIFGSAVKAAISSKDDGNMKYGIGDDGEVEKNRRLFLDKVGISIDHATLVGITYATDDFAKYRIAKPSEKTIGMRTMENVEHADALVVEQPGHALFLPLADCVGVVLYDDDHHVLMVSHIGRHSAEIEGARRSVEFLAEQYGTDPATLKIWLSPGVGKASYPLHKFKGESLHEVIARQLVGVGVSMSHIENSHIDTATSSNYYSHSEYLKGNDDQGRFAIVAEMCEQGEPAF